MNKNGNFKSTVGFVLACVGSAVGMGNIWMFPYRLGQYGGAAFLIPYLIFIALFGLVGLSAEFALGRMAKTGTLGAYTYCSLFYLYSLPFVSAYLTVLSKVINFCLFLNGNVYSTKKHGSWPWDKLFSPYPLLVLE